MKNFNNENFNKSTDGIKLLSRCPACQNEHDPSETSILDETEDSHLLYIKCNKCGSGVVASISPANFGMISLGVITDLNAFEIKQFKNKEKITQDDVLNFISYFKEKKDLN